MVDPSEYMGTEFYFVRGQDGSSLAGDFRLDEALKNYCDSVKGRIVNQDNEVVYRGDEDEVQG